jgi:hypothetical protein
MVVVVVLLMPLLRGGQNSQPSLGEAKAGRGS